MKGLLKAKTGTIWANEYSKHKINIHDSTFIQMTEINYLKGQKRQTSNAASQTLSADALPQRVA